MYRNAIQLNTDVKERTNEEGLMNHRKGGGGGGGRKKKREGERERSGNIKACMQLRLKKKKKKKNYLHVASHDYQKVIQHTYT